MLRIQWICHHFVEASFDMLSVDEPLYIAAERETFQSIDVGVPDVDILLSVEELPAHPADHCGVISAIFVLGEQKRELVLLSCTLNHLP